ncbi:MAG TPA: L-threonylcarbamoyladenylate synthase [Thermoanaerobaculia bacterium]|nr:L-threonylcarbamoyladenylate synthase [Thermoanaerobaculia bacterium]
MLTPEPTRLNRSGLLGLGALSELVAALARGACVVLPADTGYMFAVDALSARAIENLFAIKQRSLGNPIHVAVASLRQAKELVHVSPKARELMEHFLPGALTVVMPKKERVPDLLVAHTGNLGIRIPNSPAVLQLCSEFGGPVTATSVNYPDEPPSYDARVILTAFGSKIDFLVEANEFDFERSSTVVRIVGDQVELLREGPIDKAAIESVVGTVGEGALRRRANGPLIQL